MQHIHQFYRSHAYSKNAFLDAFSSSGPIILSLAWTEATNCECIWYSSMHHVGKLADSILEYQCLTTGMGDEKQYTAILMVAKRWKDFQIIRWIFVSPNICQFWSPLRPNWRSDVPTFAIIHLLSSSTCWLRETWTCLFLQLQSVCDNKYTLEIFLFWYHLFSCLEIFYFCIIYFLLLEYHQQCRFSMPWIKPSKMWD